MPQPKQPKKTPSKTRNMYQITQQNKQAIQTNTTQPPKAFEIKDKKHKQIKQWPRKVTNKRNTIK